MAWTAPFTAVANTAFTAAQFNTYVRDNLLETAPAKAGGESRYFVGTGTNSIAERQFNQATVATSETTTSTSYTDLATVGPAVTVTSGSRAIVIASALVSNGTAGESCSFSVAVSGASSSSASDGFRGYYVREGNTTGSNGARFSAMHVRTGLTPGSNVFTMQYKVSGGTGTFIDRTLIVFPL